MTRLRVVLVIGALGATVVAGCGDDEEEPGERGRVQTTPAQAAPRQAERQRPGTTGGGGQAQAPPAGGAGDRAEPSRPPSSPGGGDEPASLGRKVLASLKPGRSRESVEEELGRPPAPTFVDPMIRSGEPKRSACTYYRLKTKEYLQLCYRKDKLQTILTFFPRD